ncbi:hypothetical protein BGW38_010913 [Lunasporangiospora selenospora]|uniref:Uncharacterized protein n=1 Tax=Lunasporangiospora selenospora TaxID=979761 RepID=A0A9P6G2J6_9FUNG|nr:hypothetical protein BGW38_010913 [Lunasporangiospora selenospora]
MYMISRSPILKLGIAVLINIGLIAICQRYWSISSAHVQRQLQSEQQEFFRIQKLQQDQHRLPLYPDRPPLYPDRQDTESAPPLRVVEVPGNLHSFQVSEELKESHDIAIPRDIPAWTAEDTAMLNTVTGLTLMNELLKSEYNQDDTVNDASKLDFEKTSRSQRLYKSLWNHVYALYQQDGAAPGTGTAQEREHFLFELSHRRAEVDFLFRLEQKLYPWLHHQHRSSFSMYDSFDGKGFVYCAGNGQFEFVISSIQCLRKLQPRAPIQIFYIGNSDLDQKRQTYLRGMTNDIEVVDVTTILDNGWMQLSGWSIKAFALLASRFEEAMFIDSDAFFLQDPALLFEDPGYKATGALFFYDRTLWPGWKSGPNWLRSIMPIMSTYPPTSRSFRGTTSHEQESGVVVINKRTRFQGLLAACKMNSRWERDLHSYRIFYGDKETFWTGFEMAQEPYAFMRTFGGAIGEMRDSEANNQDIQRTQEIPPSVCGAQLHLDYLGQPMWWNGGLMRNKNSGDGRDLDFGFWMSGGGLQKHRELIELKKALGVNSLEGLEKETPDPAWIFEESCIYGGPVERLSDLQRDLLKSFQRINKVSKADGEEYHRGKTVEPSDHDWANL